MVRDVVRAMLDELDELPDRVAPNLSIRRLGAVSPLAWLAAFMVPRFFPLDKGGGLDSDTLPHGIEMAVDAMVTLGFREPADAPAAAPDGGGNAELSVGEMLLRAGADES